MVNFPLFGSDSAGNDEYATVELTEDICTQIADAADDAPKGISVRPFKDNEGIQGGIDLLESLHNPTTSGRLRTKNASPAHAYEIQYTNGRLNFQFVPANDDWLGTFSRQLKDKYPNSQFETADSDAVTAEPGMHVAGARIGLKKYTLYPIKHVGVEGFSRDPFGGITSELVGTRKDGEAPADVLLQVMFRPALDSWWQGVDGGPSTTDIGTSLQSPSYRKERRLFTRTTIEDPPSQKEKNAAKIVRDMENEHGWELNLRVLAVSDDPEVARQRASSSSTMFRNYYESSTGQRFEAEPLSGSDLRESLTRAAGREFADQDVVKSESETAGLVHVPNSEINQQDVQWALSRAGYGVAPGTPRVDFGELGVAMEDDLTKQIAMIASSDRGDPYMFGLGTRNGIEAGVTEDTLDTHMFVGGQSGRGKTSFGKNLFRQVTDRDYGCLAYDPKGMDAEDFASLVPDHREDDLIFIELGSNRDHQVGFNFLEVPGGAEPGTPEHSAALEAMADDIEAILPLASGSEATWGTRMSRIARNIARGLGKLDREVTLYDAHLIASEAAGREAYAGLLDEEDINFIKDYAMNHLAEMDNDVLEPFAGRLQQLIENETVREIVTIKDGFSIDKAVEEGKIIIVQDNDPSSTTGKMVATTLLRRLWVSIREQEYDDDRPDPDQFYAILDEFNEIATVNSDVADIFADARSFGLSLIALTQDMSGQLGDEIADAVEGQAETFITYTPGREEDARTIASQHSEDMEYSDLMDLPKYRFLMRTHDDEGELTHSYKVNATPPIDEVAPDVARSEEETEALIDRRVREVGSKRRTDEEIMNSASLYDGQAGADINDEELSTLLGNEHAERKIIKAIYDAGIRNGDSVGHDSVPSALAHEAVASAFDDLSMTQLSDLIEQLSVMGLLDTSLSNGDTHVSVTLDGLKRLGLKSGSGGSAGGSVHRELLRRMYIEMTRLGYDSDIPEQGGDELADAVGRLPPELNTMGLSEALEHLRNEYPAITALSGDGNLIVEAESRGLSKPAGPIKNYAKADRDRHQLLFAVAEAGADGTDNARKLANIFTKNQFTSNRPPADVARKFYTKNRCPAEAIPSTAADPTTWYAIHPNPDVSTQWVEHADGSVVCRTDEGETVARFEDYEAFAERSPEDFPGVRYYDDDNDVHIAEWTDADGDAHRIKRAEGKLNEAVSNISYPRIPELVFDDDVPTPDDVAEEIEIVIVPDEPEAEGAPVPQLAVYDIEAGETTPLAEYLDAEMAGRPPMGAVSESDTDSNATVKDGADDDDEETDERSIEERMRDLGFVDAED